MFISAFWLDGFIQHQASCLGRFFKEFQKLFVRGWIVVFSRGVCQKNQTSRREEWHSIDGVVQVIFTHGTRVKTSGVHISTSGVGEIRLKVFELARDSKLIVAEEEVDVGHEFTCRRRAKGPLTP